MLSKVFGSMDPEQPEDSDGESGPFGLSKDRKDVTCMSPSIVMLLILLICPPFAIIYRWGFLKGFVPAIICGVMCVKLYYFPGLLLATLMVLC